MAKYNFFERMEREINFQFEYEKIEDIILWNDYKYDVWRDIVDDRINGKVLHPLVELYYIPREALWFWRKTVHRKGIRC